MGNDNERKHDPAENWQEPMSGGQSSSGEALPDSGGSPADDPDHDIGPGGQSEVGGASDLGGGETGLGSSFVESEEDQGGGGDFARDGQGALDDDQERGSGGSA